MSEQTPNVKGEMAASVNVIAVHMGRVYRKGCGPDWQRYMSSQERTYADIRHLVRSRMAQFYEVGPTAIARAEGELTGHTPNHATVINSFNVAREVLPEAEPELVELVNRTILNFKC